MTGHNGNIDAIMSYLEQQDRDYKLATNDKDRGRIQDRTRIYMDDVKDDIYSKLSEGAATGLFGSGHSFNQDMALSLMRLKEMKDND